MSLFILYNHT